MQHPVVPLELEGDLAAKDFYFLFKMLHISTQEATRNRIYQKMTADEVPASPDDPQVPLQSRVVKDNIYEINRQSVIFLESPALIKFIPFSRAYPETIERDINIYFDLIQEDDFDQRALGQTLFYIHLAIGFIIRSFQFTFNLGSPEMAESLLSYMQTAQEIMRLPRYQGTNMKRVDDFIKSPADFFDANREAFGIPAKVNFKLDTSFVALAAPSFEGKTQTAFTIRSSNVLYFVLSSAQGAENMQDIYRPFIYHSNFLKSIALVDLVSLGVDVSSTEDAPSATQLSCTVHKAKPLFVLGFFLNIMEQTRARRQRLGFSVAEYPQLPNWMEFFATELSSFTCSPISVTDFITRKASFDDKFAIFLDEFLAKGWAVYIRNLSRAVGITCVVSNTNTNAANLVSRGADDSRTGPFHLWCIAFKRLDNVSLEVLGLDTVAGANSVNLTARDTLMTIRQFCARNQQTANLFDTLFGEWLSKSRPGVAVLIIDALEELKTVLEANSNSEVSIAEVLQFVCTNVASKFSMHKTRMVSRLNGQLAKFGLMTHAAFADAANLGEKSLVFKSIRFLENHLFYLLNPTGLDLDFFFTSSPTEDTGILHLIRHTGANQNLEWKMQLTTFREDELFTFLASLFVPLTHSPNSVLHRATVSNMTSDVAMAKLPNLNAFKLSGDHLEVSVGITCVEASHHSAGAQPSYTLRGVDGFTWMKNIVSNLCLSQDFRSQQLSVHQNQNQARKFDLVQWLEAIRIPFLYGINHSNSWMEQLADCPFSEVFARQYLRTPDSSSIDGCFQFVQELRRSRRLLTCCIECKNYQKPVNASDLNTLILKAINGRKFDPRTGSPSPEDLIIPAPGLFLIFTNDVAESRTQSQLRQTCTRNRINLFCVKENLVLSPYNQTWKMYKYPKTVGIIFEVDSISNANA